MEGTSKMIILLIIGFFIYQLVSYLSDPGPQRVQRQRGGSGSGNKHKLYLFYTTWCPHCTKIRCGQSATTDDCPNGSPNPQSAWGKTFYSLKNDAKSKVKPVEIDADKERELLGRYGVEGYPTIILAKGDGSHKEYAGDNTHEGIMDFLKKETGVSV